MKKGWVIYSKETLSSKFGNNAFDWMVESASKYDMNVEVLFEEDFDLLTSGEQAVFLLNGKELAKPDFAVMRSYGLDLARHLESSGVPVFNKPTAMAISQDKWQTHQVLCKKGLRSPDTLWTSTPRTYSDILSILGSTFVVKGLLGSKGEDVYLVEGPESYDKALKQLKGQSVLYQRFVSESAGTDIRVHVIGGQVVAAVRRVSEGDFKSNFHQGGAARAVAITEEMKDLSLAAAKALELDFAGIDLLESLEGPTICEVNAIPGFRTICLTSETDIPSLIFEHVAKVL
ncbi:ATP-grasp domain-containing protein [Fusibacter sp. JL216-2]|uniref:ATP-grasp domain-containing protein n=1 Tax=Fusibacter sp. JL216-2 TaxID=3071453 RepID=UPI003D333AD7